MSDVTYILAFGGPIVIAGEGHPLGNGNVMREWRWWSYVVLPQ